MNHRICLVTGGQLPIPDVLGGAAEHLITTLINQNEEDYKFDFTVICVDSESSKECKQYKHTNFVRFSHEKFAIESVIRDLLKRFLRKIFRHPFYNIRKYERAVEKYLLKNYNNFDCIINETAEPPIMYRIAKKYGTNKLVWHLHSHTQASELYDRCYGATLCVSDFVRHEYSIHSSIPNNRHQTLYNVVDSNLCDQTSLTDFKKELGFTEEDFIILYCGRLVEIKGVLELTKAVISINDPKIKLLIVGSSNFAEGKETSYSQEITKLVNQHSHKLKMTGFVSREDLSKYFGIANIGVVPSLCEEAFSLVLCEFMMAGLPTIATKSGGMVEVGKEDTTMFIDNGENVCENIRNAILQLYANSDKLMSMKSNAKVVSMRFNSHNYLENFFNCVNRII